MFTNYTLKFIFCLLKKEPIKVSHHLNYSSKKWGNIFSLLLHAHTHHTHTHTLTVPLIVRGLPDVYIEKLLVFLAQRLTTSPHLQFYLAWCVELLTAHTAQLKEDSSAIMAPLRDLLKSIVQKKNDLGKMSVNYIGSHIV